MIHLAVQQRLHVLSHHYPFMVRAPMLYGAKQVQILKQEDTKRHERTQKLLYSSWLQGLDVSRSSI